MRTIHRTTALLALGLAACRGDMGQPQISIAGFVASVTVEGETATVTLESGTPPAQNAAPVIEATLPAAAINGGTFAVAVTSVEPFSELVLGMPGTPDWFHVTLPTPRTAARLLVTLDPGAPAGAVDLFVAGGASPTQYGPYLSHSLSVMRVGSGDVQVSVAWNTAADVDLHVVDPAGEEVYWGSRTSASGGELDLDSNAGCGSDQPRNENTVWPVNGAPTGTYIVRLDHWDACGAAQTDWVVTVWVRGQEAQVFSGSFTGLGEHGGEGAGIEITTFSR